MALGSRRIFIPWGSTAKDISAEQVNCRMSQWSDGATKTIVRSLYVPVSCPVMVLTAQ